ncbi:ABC transporter substrate-binding protein [Brevibacterium casei]|uniref:ABC transporter substrate-binding protein n=1 Tax=Brevibacterium casei TaxID=33889 RepID=UPI00223B5A56|nr:extracellular solute-binding protein [Brevibacterium casei]MCT1550050.1 extracellular solute-binding protein [Brevibacterium casei]MCT1559267.1 extracellular solute-binding protein [Brevibacterium casei]MCT2207996.1 extracellular solute-binding protein [Brevibacterium casei]
MAMHRRFLAASSFLFVGFLALPLTACGNGSAQGSATAADLSECSPEGVTITAQFLSYGAGAAENAKQRLEADYEGLTVELKEAAGTGYDELTQQVVADIAAGARPDVTMVGLNQVSFWVDRYQPQPLDISTLSDTYDQRFLEAGSIDGVPYTAPFQASVPVLFTNTSLTGDAGVTDAPTSYSEWLDAAVRVSDHTGAASVNVPRTAIADWPAQAFIQSAGGTLMDEGGMPAFDTEEGHAGLSILEEFGARGLHDSIDVTEALNLFTSGKLPYLVYSPQIAATFQDQIGDAFEWSVTDLPIADGGTAELPVGGNGWIVLAQDECEAGYANELIAEMLSTENIVESSKDWSYIPVDTEAARILAEDPAAQTQVGYAWGYEGTPTPWGGWPGNSTPSVNQALEDMVQRLTNGESVDVVVPETVQRIEREVQ